MSAWREWKTGVTPPMKSEWTLIKQPVSTKQKEESQQSTDCLNLSQTRQTAEQIRENFLILDSEVCGVGAQSHSDSRRHEQSLTSEQTETGRLMNAEGLSTSAPCRPSEEFFFKMFLNLTSCPHSSAWKWLSRVSPWRTCWQPKEAKLNTVYLRDNPLKSAKNMSIILTGHCKEN